MYGSQCAGGGEGRKESEQCSRSTSSKSCYKIMDWTCNPSFPISSMSVIRNMGPVGPMAPTKVLGLVMSKMLLPLCRLDLPMAEQTCRGSGLGTGSILLIASHFRPENPAAHPQACSAFWHSEPAEGQGHIILLGCCLGARQVFWRPLPGSQRMALPLGWFRSLAVAAATRVRGCFHSSRLLA